MVVKLATRRVGPRSRRALARAECHLFDFDYDPAPAPAPVFDADEATEIDDLIAKLNAGNDVDEEATEDECGGLSAAQQLSVYQEITDLLVSKGIPREHIAWIHDAKDANSREALFTKMRKGVIRVLLGSTFRMGVGVNVQERCYAVHHLTTPWRPCDVKQADGRIWRPGNLFPNVWVCRYIAAPSFDGFMWQGIETKGKFADAYERGDPAVRVMKDIDEQIISAGEIKALASGDPRIVQKVRLEHELEKLQQQRDGWEGTRRTARYGVVRAEDDAGIHRMNAHVVQQYIEQRGEAQTLTLLDKDYDLSDPKQHKALGKDIRDALVTWGTTQSMNELKRIGRITAPAGRYRNVPLYVVLGMDNYGKVTLPTLFLGTDGGERLSESTIYIGDRAEIVNRMEQASADLDKRLARLSAEAARLSAEAARVRETLEIPWEHERTYRMMQLGLRYLNAVLNDDATKTDAVIAEVLALAESEGLDIDGIIKKGQEIEEKGIDLSQIRVQLPPLSAATAAQAKAVAPETLTPITTAPDETPRAPTPTPTPAPAPTPAAEEDNYVSLSIFADPLLIARPTLEFAKLDLKDMATEAARKKAEIENKKRKKAVDAGQVSFLDF